MREMRASGNAQKHVFPGADGNGAYGENRKPRIPVIV